MTQQTTSSIVPGNVSSTKVAVITGASSGIGEAVAAKLLKQGYIVYNLSRRANNTVLNIQCDVSQPEQIYAAIKQIAEEQCHIDLVVSNAGYGIAGSIEAAVSADLDRQLDVNLHGAIHLAKAVLPYLRKSCGRIIIVSSVAGAVPIPFQTAYSVSKAGLIALTLGLANELRGTGANAVAILPGDVSTGFTAARKPVDLSAEPLCYRERCAASLKRMENDELHGKPAEHIAAAIVKAAAVNHPKPLYPVDISYKAAVLLFRFLPIRLANYIVGKLYA